MYTLYLTLHYFLRAMELAIIAYFVLSLLWPRGTLTHRVGIFLAPFLRPFRVLNMKIAARFNLPLDLSLLLALLGIDLIRYLIQRLFFAILL